MSKSVIKPILAILFGVVVVSCSKDFYAEQEATVEEFSANFENIVMGDLNIHPDQTWNTSVATKANISVDLNYNEEYKVYIYGSAPLINKNAAWIGFTKIKSGESKTITLAKSASTVGLYAALYDKNNHAVVMPLTMNSDNSYSIAFGGNSLKARSRSVSTGNRWSVTTATMPSLTDYTTNVTTLVDGDWPNGNNNTRPANTVTKYTIPQNTSYDIIVPKLAAGKDDNNTVVSMYVEGEWTISGDQRLNVNNIIVVGPNGTINITSTGSLTTNDDNLGNAGMIYVMPGGKITGDGSLVLANGTKGFSFNAGTIDVATLNNNGGVLYNTGTIGTDSKPVTYICGAGTTLEPGRFINHGHAVFSSVTGQGLSFENACSMKVIGELYIGMSSKMDNGSYVECGTLDLHGDNSSYNKVLYMGEGSFMDIKEDINILNFGVWGPNTAAGSTNRAYFSVPNSVQGKNPYTQVNVQTGEPTTFMLDNVELIIPDDFDAQVTNNGYSCNAQGQLLYAYYNGLNYTTVNPAASNPYEWMWQGYTYQDQQTCQYGLASSYTKSANEDGCGVTVETTSNEDGNTGGDTGGDTSGETGGDTGESTENIEVPENCNWVYYAFEDLGGTKDFDFNDEVIRVSTPVDGKSIVQILAVGAELNAYILYNGSRLGKEVHAAIGTSDHVITNTKVPSVVPGMFRVLGEINVPDGTSIGNLDFGLEVLNSDGTTRNVVASRINSSSSTDKSSYGKAPLYLVINGDENGKWYWPRELVNITNAFSNFSTWGSTLSEGVNWYKPANATSGNVVTW